MQKTIHGATYIGHAWAAGGQRIGTIHASDDWCDRQNVGNVWARLDNAQILTGPVVDNPWAMVRRGNAPATNAVHVPSWRTTDAHNRQTRPSTTPHNAGRNRLPRAPVAQRAERTCAYKVRRCALHYNATRRETRGAIGQRIICK